MFNYSLDNFSNINHNNCIYNNSTLLVDILDSNDGNDNLSHISLSFVENLDEIVLANYGIKDVNIKLIKCITKNLSNLIEILENNQIENYFKFYKSSYHLTFNTTSFQNEERFI